MQDNWYENNTGAETLWYAPASASQQTAPQRKRRLWIRILAVCILGAAIITGAVFLINNNPFLPSPEGESATQPPESVKDLYKLPEDYRDYFNQLYGAMEEKEECLIPRVESYESAFELSLSEKGTQELSYTEIYAKCAPTVVAIHAYVDAERADGFYWGTGFIIRSDGYILTNAHIIEGTSRATVTLWDDSVHEALLVGYDSRNDLAVLKIEADDLPVAEFCDSDAMEIGEPVVAIGNPLGEQFRSTMTEGIISGIGRAISYNGATLELIQTSAPLNEGNSGGPLINMYGQVIGVTNMKMNSSYGTVSIEGLGFAIPSHIVKELTDSILASGEVTGRPALGAVVGAIPEAAREHYSLPEGLYITEVKHGSDCEMQGLVAGDILTAVNGDTVTETQQVLDKIKPLSVGDTLVLSIWRDGEEFDVTVTLVDMNRVY